MSRKHRRSIFASTNTSPHHRQKPKKRNLSWLWVGLGALLIATVGILLFRPKAADSTELTLAQAKVKIQQGAFILDVRTQQEWDQFRIAGSTLIPLDELPNRLNDLPKDQDIVVVCLSGVRAQSGIVILQQAGFKHIFYLSGGLNAWKSARYPLEVKTP
jgi:rhodanese-related sulfurtransferase